MQELLDRIGWSQIQAGRHMNVDGKTVNHWCKHGKDMTRSPGYKTAMRFLEMVARFLGV